MHKSLLTFILLFGVTLKTYSQLTLDKHFSDHMVLQRDQPITLSGRTEAEALVMVEFMDEKYQSHADKTGNWSVVLPKQQVQRTGQSLVIRSKKQQIRLEDILIGDVWLCIGQSNMEFALEQEKHYAEEKDKLHRALLRFYNPTFAGKYIYNKQFTDSVLELLTPEKFYSTVDWEVSSAESAPSMSAVGYYFATSIIEATTIPTGLINLAIGGAPIETFIPADALANHPEFSTMTKGNWLLNDALPVWVRERGKQNVGKKALFADKLGANHAYKPGFAFTSGIEGLAKFPIRGILWYQGESNAQEMDMVMQYNALGQLMLQEYRDLWKMPRLPFYYTQLSSIDTIKYQGQLWPEFRNQQRLFLTQTKNTGMVVSSDIGARHDVHPKDKRTIGQRMSRWVLRDVYGHNITASGPLVTTAKYRKNKLEIHFKFIGEGLTFEGDNLLGFYVDGNSVKAQIKGTKVVISLENKPKEVAYGLAPFSLGNLSNKEGLPASSFILKIE